jgi:hypothetical protein
MSIRGLGGLLSAHTLAPSAILLELAALFGWALLPAFDSPSGVPYCSVNLRHANASCAEPSFREPLHQGSAVGACRWSAPVSACTRMRGL